MGNDKTKWIFDESDDDPFKDGSGPEGEMTETLDGPAGSDPTFVGSNDPTMLVPQQGASEAPEKTQIFTGSNAGKFSQEAGFDDQTDPVTGWLVIVRGPGLGRSVALGSGMNIVGRGPGARASLPFGDTLISSDDHVRIIYDDADRRFYIAHGSGKNISRVNGQLLANTMDLANDAVIDLSKQTRVVFKQFCGEGFDWGDLDQGARAER